MPAPSAGGTSSSSNVFARLTGKRPQVYEIEQNNATQERLIDDTGGLLPSEVPAEGDKSKLLNGHKRESSVLSLTSSVTDLGQTVRRSVSLRSHRTQPSGNSIGHRPRYPSSGNLLSKSPPLTAAVEDGEVSPEADTLLTQQPPTGQPQRSRGRFVPRSLSQRFRSTDTLPLFEQGDDAKQRPPVPTLNIDPSQAQPSMLAASVTAKRQTSDRPGLAAQTNFVREISSSHGSVNSLPMQPASTTGGGQNPLVTYNTIHETAAKRMATIEYLRKIHEGNVFYFNILHYSAGSLSSSIPSLHSHKLGRRATNYLALGYSLPLLSELHSNTPLEYLRALAALLQEFETYQNLSGVEGSTSSLSRARVGQMFKSGIGLGNRNGIRSGRRSSAATDSIALDPSRLGLPLSSGGDATSPIDPISPVNAGHDFSHLLTPHLPFDPDFNMTFTTLCDTLVVAYRNLLALIPDPDLCSVSVGDTFAKADKLIRKILVANVVREFEESTRQGVKTEVAGLGRLVLGGLM